MIRKLCLDLETSMSVIYSFEYCHRTNSQDHTVIVDRRSRVQKVDQDERLVRPLASKRLWIPLFIVGCEASRVPSSWKLRVSTLSKPLDRRWRKYFPATVLSGKAVTAVACFRQRPISVLRTGPNNCTWSVHQPSMPLLQNHLNKTVYYPDYSTTLYTCHLRQIQPESALAFA